MDHAHKRGITELSYIRRLPSGKWQATVRGPDGHKHTRADPLKKVVRAWAADLESRFRQGEIRDPRAGDVRVGDWHARYAAASGVEKITAAKNASLWSTHCEPKWSTWRMAAITRMEAQGWVGELRETKLARYRGRDAGHGEDAPFLSADTIAAIVHIMSALFRAAMKEHPPVVMANPFAELDLPVIEPRPVEFYEPDEAAALYEAIERLSGPGWRTFAGLGMDAGLRLGELSGLHGHRVDWLRGRLAVVDVMTRQGLRQWPKSKKSHRVVPVPPVTLEGMSVLMAGRERDALVFTAPEGGPISDRNFANRIWFPAIAAAGVRRFPPRIMRHTAASWLVQDGVPLYDVQALLGHESFATTQRYAHLAPDAHSKVLESWARRPGAPAAHGTKTARPS
jgi:integrase